MKKEENNISINVENEISETKENNNEKSKQKTLKHPVKPYSIDY